MKEVRVKLYLQDLYHDDEFSTQEKTVFELKYVMLFIRSPFAPSAKLIYLIMNGMGIFL